MQHESFMLLNHSFYSVRCKYIVTFEKYFSTSVTGKIKYDKLY
jgi:hypothetical protein